MKKEIKIYWRVEADKPSLTIQYCLIGDIAAMTFTVRAPTENWDYWLPTGIDYHAKEQQYEGQLKIPCTLMEQKFCYADGTSIGAEELWSEFVKSDVKEEIIWDKLQEWMSNKFPGCI